MSEVLLDLSLVCYQGEKARQFLADLAMVLDGAYRQNFKTTINLLLHFAVANTKEDRFVAPGRHWAPQGRRQPIIQARGQIWVSLSEDEN